MEKSNLIWRNKDGDIRAVWSILILIATIGIVANPLVLLLDLSDIRVLESSLKNVAVAVAVAIGLWIIVRISSYQAEAFGWRTSKQLGMEIVMGIAAGSVPIYLIVASGWGFGFLSVQDKPGTDFENVSVLAAILGQAVRYLSGSFFEEAVSRGFLFYLVLTRVPLVNVWQRNLTALLLSSLLFSVLHLGNSDLTLWAYLNLALVGVWFGLLYLATGSLFAPLAAHFAWNFFQNNIFGMPNGGGASKAWLLLVQPEVDNVLSGGSLGPEGSVIITGVLTAFILVMLPWAIKRELIVKQE